MPALPSVSPNGRAFSAPPHTLVDGPYTLSFASNDAAFDAVARLRFEVFNIELEEGLDASFDTGKDVDPFDAQCHHLMIAHEKDGIIGTYRLQTNEMAKDGLGFYSATVFDLSSIPDDVRDHSVELGRACIALDHRSLKVLYLLWKGIGLYVQIMGKRYLFGCSSLTSQDPVEGHRVYRFFERKGNVHPTINVAPQEDYVCHWPAGIDAPSGKPKVPRLMRAYLSLGAKVCSQPAIDREFKTIDYFTLFDTAKLNRQAQAYFMPTSR